MDENIGFEPYRPRQKNRVLIAEARKYAEREKPVTIKQLFYHLVGRNLLPNTKKKYNSFDRIMVKARKAWMIPFEWIEDRSRRSLIVPLFESAEDFLKEAIEEYYKDTWPNQPYFIAIFLEKEALAGIVWSVASQFYVPVFPTKGYSSWSIFYKDLRTEVHKRLGKPLVALVIGDYDPSGVDIPKDHINKLHFLNVYPDVIERIALTQQQVTQHKLPPQMAKKSDPRFNRFLKQHGKFSVEVDALKPSVLKELVCRGILNYLDSEIFKEDLKAESLEKTSLRDQLRDFLEYCARSKDAREKEESMGADG